MSRNMLSSSENYDVEKIKKLSQMLRSKELSVTAKNSIVFQTFRKIDFHSLSSEEKFKIIQEFEQKGLNKDDIENALRLDLLREYYDHDMAILLSSVFPREG